MIDIGGVSQFVMIRGVNIQNPILLLLHGGNTETAHFAKFNKDLEHSFTVVYWDQRGEGKSNHKTIDASLLTLDRYVEDLHELTLYLKERFVREKIYLLGHSMGTLLGMKVIERYPEDYIAYVAVSQVADPIQSDNIAYDTLEKQIEEKNHPKDLQKLHTIERITKENIMDMDLIKRTNDLLALVIKYGGLYFQTTLLKLFKVSFLPLLTFKEYSLKEKFKAITQHKERIQFYYQNNLMESLLKVEVPVFFLHGKDDLVVNYDLTKAYFEKLKAPQKEFITFEYSGHFPPFEEAEKFHEIMIDKILSL
jgi:pimeloyl-ACP methyl ester carboxylesterase